MGAGLGEGFIGDGGWVVAHHHPVLTTDSEDLPIGGRLAAGRHIAPLGLVLGDRLADPVQQLILAEDRA
jgi:hypothetical protein